VVNSCLVDDLTIRQTEFDLPICCWPLPELLLDQPRPPRILSEKVLPCSNRHVPLWQMPNMSHIVNSCPQCKLEGAAAIALSWWHCYRMAEDIRLINALDNNNRLCLWYYHLREKKTPPVLLRNIVPLLFYYYEHPRLVQECVGDGSRRCMESRPELELVS